MMLPPSLFPPENEAFRIAESRRFQNIHRILRGTLRFGTILLLVFSVYAAVAQALTVGEISFGPTTEESPSLPRYSPFLRGGQAEGLGTFRLYDRLYPRILTPVPPIDNPPDTDTDTNPDPPSPPSPVQLFPAADLSGTPSIGEILFQNETSFRPDAAALLRKPYRAVNRLADTSLPVSGNPSPADSKEPIVLIFHTHATESYAGDAADYTGDDMIFRSSDCSRNVVRIGQVMTDALEAAGIPTLHCTELFDEQSYVDSYNLSLQALRRYLQAHPSIRYVLDVHRDAIKQDNTMLRPVTEIDGKSAAQLMLVVGTSEGGGNHPLWQQNLSLALHLQTALQQRSPSLARPINLRRATFNAQYTTGSLLVEVGACGNTLEEAERTAAYFGQTLADFILHQEDTNPA